MKRFLLPGIIIIAALLVVLWYLGLFGGLHTESGVSGSYQNAIDGAKSEAQRVAEQSKMAPAPAGDSAGSVVVYDGISFPKNTVIIDLGKKGLTGSLKAEIRQLTNLRELYLDGNDFTGVPAEIGQLSNLETLDLSNNPHITGLPLEIGNLKKLKLLNVTGTSYSKQDLEKIQQMLPATTQVITNKNPT
jgi:Leucine-rich repeat (LRR) protein